MEKVQLGKEVKTVDYTNMDKIVVTLIDGTQYNAKHVIFTPSLGVLKRQHSTIFNPPLPQSKQHAIQGIAFGSVLKFFLEYSQPWWPSDLESYSLLWSNKDQEEFIATHGKVKNHEFVSSTKRKYISDNYFLGQRMAVRCFPIPRRH